MTVQAVDLSGNELDYAVIPQRALRLSRAEYIELLWRRAGSPVPQGSSPFVDVDLPAVTWSYEAGYILGYGGGRFGPEDLMLDWQVALVMERMEA